MYAHKDIYVLRPATALPKTSKTGAFEFDISRLTGSCAFIYIWAKDAPIAAMIAAVTRKIGAYSTTALSLVTRLVPKRTERRAS